MGTYFSRDDLSRLRAPRGADRDRGPPGGHARRATGPTRATWSSTTASSRRASAGSGTPFSTSGSIVARASARPGPSSTGRRAPASRRAQAAWTAGGGARRGCPRRPRPGSARGVRGRVVRDGFAGDLTVECASEAHGGGVRPVPREPRPRRARWPGARRAPRCSRRAARAAGRSSAVQRPRRAAPQRKSRDALLDRFDVVAPCTHRACGMLADGGSDWCHQVAGLRTQGGVGGDGRVG